MRKNFIPRNEEFVCEQCGKEVLPAKSTFRNHCPFCLTSKHVDGIVPGDRKSNCGGLMPTTTIEGVDPDKLDLVQQCIRCGHVRRNKVARDDSRQVIFSRMETQ